MIDLIANITDMIIRIQDILQRFPVVAGGNAGDQRRITVLNGLCFHNGIHMLRIIIVSYAEKTFFPSK